MSPGPLYDAGVAAGEQAGQARIAELEALLAEERASRARYEASALEREARLIEDLHHARHHANEQFALHWLPHYSAAGGRDRIIELERLERISAEGHREGDLLASDGWQVGQDVE